VRADRNILKITSKLLLMLRIKGCSLKINMHVPRSCYPLEVVGVKGVGLRGNLGEREVESRWTVRTTIYM